MIANFYHALVPGGYLYLQLPLFEQKRIFPEKWFLGYEKEESWRLDGSVSSLYDRPRLERDLRSVGFDICCIYFTTGFWGRLAFELSHLLSEKNRVCYAMSLPLLKLFTFFDVIVLDKKSGDGIVALCRKPLA